MDYVTTTDLRTQTPHLITALKQGLSVFLMHRSQIIGTISPAKSEKPAMTAEMVSEMYANLPKISSISSEERDRIYREHLMEKYGKDLP